ncbi:MAG: protein kinase, partial [Magnetococcales bacterium]|nr:protein kinase [Magnetococcales bacterium]
RVVLIGITDPRLAPPLQTPATRPMSPLEIHAQAVASLLDGHDFRIPEWAGMVRHGLYATVALLMLLAAPGGVAVRLGTLLAAMLLGVLVPVVAFWMLDAHAWWVPMMAPLALLVVGSLVPLILRPWFRPAPDSGLPAGHDTIHRALGLAYQGQQCWELALEQFRLCAMDEMMMAIFRHLGHDLEAARRLPDALQIYQRMSRHDPDHPGLAERLQRVQTLLNQQQARPLPGAPFGTAGVHRVGRYDVMAELCRDALGTLLLGQDPESGEAVILRLPGPALHRDPERAQQAREAFLADGHAWMKLRHEGIVSLLAMDLEAKPAYLVMEHFPISGNLERHVHPDDPLPLTLILYIITRAALALDHAHQRGLTHGNLKPDDLIYDSKSRQLRIKEFGVARMLGTDPGGTGISPYAAPEAVSDSTEDHRSDLYALGGIFFHLLTGHPPFRADDPESLRSHILEHAVIPIPTLRPDTPPELIAIVEKCLAKSPDQRHARGGELARELIAFIRSRVEKPKPRATRSTPPS